MAHWTSLAAAERREAILGALHHHDDGWSEPDAAPTIDPETGTVRDFIGVPAAVKQAVWPRALAGLAGAPWTAALVAHHAATVYDRFRGDPAWDGFFTGMERERARLLAATGLPMDALVRDYVYVRLGDLASLAFCNAWTEPQSLGPWTIRLLEASSPAGRAQPVRARRADRGRGTRAASAALRQRRGAAGGLARRAAGLRLRASSSAAPATS